MDTDALKQQLVANMGVSDDAIDMDVTFKVSAAYSFTNSVTEDQAEEAIARANNVPKDTVSANVTTTARLLAESNADTRRLAGVLVAATISVTDAATAMSVKETASDAAGISAAFSAVTNSSVVATVAEAPQAKAEVTIKATVLVNQESEAPPLAATLQSAAQSAGLPEPTITHQSTTTQTVMMQLPEETEAAKTIQVVPAWELFLFAAAMTAASN